jgi:hypothetical protein
MGGAHAGLGLTDAHFDAVAGHFVSTLKELGVAEDLVAEATAVVESTRGQVAGATGGGVGVREALSATCPRWTSRPTSNQHVRACSISTPCEPRAGARPSVEPCRGRLPELLRLRHTLQVLGRE